MWMSQQYSLVDLTDWQWDAMGLRGELMLRLRMTSLNTHWITEHRNRLGLALKVGAIWTLLSPGSGSRAPREQAFFPRQMPKQDAHYGIALRSMKWLTIATGTSARAVPTGVTPSRGGAATETALRVARRPFSSHFCTLR